MNVHAEEKKLTPEQEKEIGTAIQRARGHFLSFWLFCSKSACRRARTCSFDPHFCMARVGPSVPQDVCDAVDGMIHAQFQGKSFDEMFAESPDRLVPYCKWLEAIKELEQKAKAGKRRTALKPPDLAAS
jgi:hypothetical protein